MSQVGDIFMPCLYFQRRTDLPYTNRSAWCLEYGNKKCHADMLNNVNFEVFFRRSIHLFDA